MTRSQWWLSSLIVVLAVPVHLIGLAFPAIYRDPPILVPQNLGTDLVTLCVVVPLFALAAVSTRRGSLRARLLWLGALGYFVYAYGMYAMAVHWNPLFLSYVALFALSLFALILGLVHTDAARLHERIRGRLPRRSVAAYLIVVAVMVGAMWLGEEVGAVLTGTVPSTVRQFETPTNIVHVFDLAIVLPAFLLAAAMLLRDRPWGTILGGMLLVKASTIGLWVVAMIGFSARAGIGAPAAYTVLFVALTVTGAALAIRFLSRIDSGRGAAPPRHPESLEAESAR